MRQLERLGVVTVEWALFSLGIVNAERDIGKVKRHDRGFPALRTAVTVRRHGGNAGLGRWYLAVGRRIHEGGEAAEDPATLTGALHDAGLPEELHAQAMADSTTWDDVVAEHTAVVESRQAFGVPTIVLDGGDGPAIFGPVIDALPADEDAVALWEHVTWLTRYEHFSELKRERGRAPDLESVRLLRARLPDVALT